MHRSGAAPPSSVARTPRAAATPCPSTIRGTDRAGRRRRSRARGRGLVALVVVAFAVACAGDAVDEDPAVQELPSPAGPGSGEPGLDASDSGVLLSWQEPDGEGNDVLYVDRWDGQRWQGRRAVARGDDFFVNWADLPSVVSTRTAGLVAHWLVRGPRGGYDYGIRLAYSENGGRSWSEPWIPHDDRTHTEHGFVSLVDLEGEGVGIVWLDGRDFAPVGGSGPSGGSEGGASAAEPAAEPEDPEMSLRFRTAGPDREPGPETLLDARTCECCQTDAAVTSEGLVVVYRDRSPEEVRDIHVVRRLGGEWTEPRAVHRDGWVIPACPVNGPAVSARESDVVAAWFTGADDAPRVQVAFSGDAGASFGAPVRVDAGNPAGRVDVQLLDDGSAAVSWLERTGGTAEIRIRRVNRDGAPGREITVGRSSEGRSSGFPRTALGPDGRLFVAWTDARAEPSRVRTARIPLSRFAEGGEG